MKFLRNLLGKKSAAPVLTPPAAQTASPEAAILPTAPVAAPKEKPVPPAPVPSQTAESRETEAPATTEILQGLAEKLKEPAAPGIWDLEGDDADPAPAEAPTRAPARSRRNKTRLIGFDTSEGAVVDLFDETDGAEADIPAAEAVTFPVGWALVVSGPGRGHTFPLTAGMSSIGRGADQAVRLNFGDSAISRSGHAAIVYDVEERTFLLGQGGKSNLVRLNGKPVISNEALTDGDEIKIGETVLRLKTLCGPDFDWSDTDDDGEESDDVAIA
ncbi:MAG: FHA domain-containing protein [Pseudomonadota bacterium]